MLSGNQFSKQYKENDFVYLYIHFYLEIDSHLRKAMPSLTNLGNFQQIRQV